MVVIGTDQLELQRCPRCGVNQPRLQNVAALQSTDYNGARPRYWVIYKCSSCGGMIMTHAKGGPGQGQAEEILPKPLEIPTKLPDRAREYLKQAINSMAAPAGAVILAASVVDSMLKAKGYKTGSPYSRIDKASDDHLITAEIAEWARRVRLDANEQRHTDESAPLPSEADAQHVIDFAKR